MAKHKKNWHKQKASICLAFLLSLSMLCQEGYAKVVYATAIKDNQPYTPNFTHLPYAMPDAKKGGVLSMARVGTFDSLNPFIDKGVAAAGSFYLYDTLLSASLDEVGVAYAQLASGLSYDTTDASWVIYKINPKARFWDGSEVTAHDVKATFEAILTKGLVSWRSYLSDIDKIEVLDKYQVKFYFKSSTNKEAPILVGQMPIFAKKSIDVHFDKATFEPLMGSGAYQVAQVDSGRSITYKRNPNYWGADVMVNQGRFNFDKIRFVYYRSDELAFEGFKAGQYRYRIEDKPQRWAKAYHFLAIKTGQVIKTVIKDNNPIAMKALVMNNRRPLFSDIRVRQALDLAFDFEWTNRALLYGQYERLSSFFQGSQLEAKGVPNQMQRRILHNLPLNDHEKSAFKGVPIPYQSRGSGHHREALLKARQLLLEAGFFYQQGQLFDNTGKRAYFEILVADDSMNRILLPYINNLKRLGFLVTIRQMDKAGYTNRRRSFDFDMIIDTFYQGSSPGIEQAYLWGSASADTQGNQNTAGIKSLAIDRLIEDLVVQEERWQVIEHAQVLDRLLRALHYMIPLYGQSGTQVAYWHGYRHADKLPSYAIGLDYWWQQEDKEDKDD